MRKSSVKFHIKRMSGRRRLRIFGKHPNLYTAFVDTCSMAHRVVHDKAVQLQMNATLTGLLGRVGVFA